MNAQNDPEFPTVEAYVKSVIGDQPQPATGCDCEGYNEDGRLICTKERGHDTDLPMPKPASGEWTVVAVGPPYRLQSYIRFSDGSTSGVMSVGAAVATKDAHNAALAAEADGWRKALSAASDLAKLTIQTLQQQLAAEKQRCANVLAMDADREREMERLEQQLADERKRVSGLEETLGRSGRDRSAQATEIQQLRKQLAAERERVQPLVDALKAIEREDENPIWTPARIAKDALAKISTNPEQNQEGKNQ